MEGINHIDINHYNHKRNVEDDIPFHCASTISQIDGKWQLTPANTQVSHNCTEVLCTHNANATLTIDSIPLLGGQELQVIGLWNGVLFTGQPDDANGKFNVSVDNSPVNLTQNNLRIDLAKNRFYITPDLTLNSPFDGPHNFEFTNEQTKVGLCLVGARFREAPSPTISSARSSISTLSSSTNPATSTSTSSTSNSSGDHPNGAEIAVAVLIPVLVILFMALLTLYLQRRRKRTEARLLENARISPKYLTAESQC